MNTDDKIILRYELMFVILMSKATKNLDGIRFLAEFTLEHSKVLRMTAATVMAYIQP